MSAQKVSIVAGGAGFVGANLCTRLLEEGRIVVVIDNLLRGSRDYLNNGGEASQLHFIEADLAKRILRKMPLPRLCPLERLMKFGTWRRTRISQQELKMPMWT